MSAPAFALNLLPAKYARRWWAAGGFAPLPARHWRGLAFRLTALVVLAAAASGVLAGEEYVRASRQALRQAIPHRNLVAAELGGRALENQFDATQLSVRRLSERLAAV